jgi:hypothetical protein
LPSNEPCLDLDVHQGTSPIGPQVAEGNPNHPVKGGQNRALLLSLKCRDLHSERCVLDGNGLMAAEEQSEESKHQHQEGWHVSDSVLHLHHSQSITNGSNIGEPARWFGAKAA